MDSFPAPLPRQPNSLVQPWVATVVAVGTVTLPSVVFVLRPESGSTSITVPMLISASAAAVIVAFRRRRPVALLTLATVNSIGVIAVTGKHSPVVLAVLILLYTTATIVNRRTARIAGVLSAVVLCATLPLYLGQPLWSTEPLAIIAWTALAIGAGEAQRNRSAYLAAVEDRMRWAEETREEEARRRVAEERLRIARELHDVVAHNMAVISVQAAAAAQLLRNDPQDAAAALESVRSSASTVLDEMGGLLHVLRGDDPSGPLDPAPTLRDLDQLIETFIATGLRVEQTDEGAVRPTSEAVQLAAYRLVQESLTNARKHGTGGAALHLTYSPSELEIDVANPIDPVARPNTSGHSLGILGIRERVAAVGGAVEIGEAPDGRFHVRARLPLSAGPAS